MALNPHLATTRPVACATNDEAQDDPPLNGDLPLVAERRNDLPENHEAQDDLPPDFNPLDDSAEESELQDGVDTLLCNIIVFSKLWI